MEKALKSQNPGAAASACSARACWVETGGMSYIEASSSELPAMHLGYIQILLFYYSSNLKYNFIGL